MIKLTAIEIDGIQYYRVRELYAAKIVSKSSLYRRKDEGRIRFYKSLNSENLIKVDDFTRHLKKTSA